jgi:hypothetical protein
MKTILIVVVLSGMPAMTAIEFDDAQSCERAAQAIHKTVRVDVRTICTPKAETKLPDRHG